MAQCGIAKISIVTEKLSDETISKGKAEYSGVMA